MHLLARLTRLGVGGADRRESWVSDSGEEFRMEQLMDTLSAGVLLSDEQQRLMNAWW